MPKNYETRTDLTIRKVFCDGGVCASFTADGAGEAAFTCFLMGAAKLGHTVFDTDRGEYLVGNVEQLAMTVHQLAG